MSKQSMPPKVLKHFQEVDDVLYEIAKQLKDIKVLPRRDGRDKFLDLVDAIVSQQLSGKAAEKIMIRFKNLFANQLVTPQNILKLKDDRLRQAGLSYSKINYIKDLAQKVASGQIDLSGLSKLSDEAVINKLTEVKGIGKWTAEMFLIFSLNRKDVFSHGDLGLNKAIRRIYNLENYSQEEVEKIVTKWSPYKSYAARILWLSLKNR